MYTLLLLSYLLGCFMMCAFLDAEEHAQSFLILTILCGFYALYEYYEIPSTVEERRIMEDAKINRDYLKYDICEGERDEEPDR